MWIFSGVLYTAGDQSRGDEYGPEPPPRQDFFLFFLKETRNQGGNVI